MKCSISCLIKNYSFKNKSKDSYFYSHFTHFYSKFS